MLVLVIVELVGFMSHTTETMVVLDPFNDQMVRAAPGSFDETHSRTLIETLPPPDPRHTP